MGLDMYLSRKNYVKNWNFMAPSELHEITVKRGGEVRGDIKPERISYIVEQVGYWRKANQIHNWFVENVQNGEDNCGEYYVSNEKLRELLNLCKSIKQEQLVPQEALPTQGGFFFGSTDYDEYYFQDIDDTIEILEPLVDVEGEYYYTSSW